MTAHAWHFLSSKFSALGLSALCAEISAFSAGARTTVEAQLLSDEARCCEPQQAHSITAMLDSRR
jgi:hypothetical protein